MAAGKFHFDAKRKEFARFVCMKTRSTSSIVMLIFCFGWRYFFGSYGIYRDILHSKRSPL